MAPSAPIPPGSYANARVLVVVRPGATGADLAIVLAWIEEATRDAPPAPGRGG